MKSTYETAAIACIKDYFSLAPVSSITQLVTSPSSEVPHHAPHLRLIDVGQRDVAVCVYCDEAPSP